MIDEKLIKKRLDMIIESKLKDEKKITGLTEQAKILKIQLQIETE